MRKVNELIVRGEPAEVVKLVERIESAPENGWKRDRGIEERLWRPSYANHEKPSTYCFTTPVTPDQPRSHLLLWRMRDGLEVSSILPVERIRLTEEQYNQILEQFQVGFLKPVIDGLDVEAKIEPFRVKLEKIVSREALERLKHFDEIADKGLIGPRDRHEWSRFVTQVHMDGSALDLEELDWWLEDAGWAEEPRRRLVEWYAEGLSMLKDYDEARVD
jgi:hypothetical protein